MPRWCETIVRTSQVHRQKCIGTTPSALTHLRLWRASARHAAQEASDAGWESRRAPVLAHCLPACCNCAAANQGVGLSASLGCADRSAAAGRGGRSHAG